MTKVVDARDAYLAAREQVTSARLQLGEAIHQARGQDVLQGQIAKELGLTREQIRRYEDEFVKAAAAQS